MARVVLLLFSAVVLAAQESTLPSLLDSLEDLQNDFEGAMARTTATYSNRQKALSIDSALGVLIGEKRNKQSLNDRWVKNLLEEVKQMEQANLFTGQDRLRLDTDSENVKYRLTHELDVFRGYKGIPHP